MKFKNVKTIFFDYDGCLHDSMIIYVPAFKKAYAYLVKSNLAPEKKWEDGEISNWIGVNGRDMWENFMPELDNKIKDICYKIVGHEMSRLILQGEPKLYKETIQVIKYLKSKGYTLVILSNCRTEYKDNHNRLFNLNKYFDKFICAQDFDFIPKHEILKKVKNSFEPEMIMIGDRYQDIEAGEINNIYTIGCSYGYAKEDELKNADICINDISELKKYL